MADGRLLEEAGPDFEITYIGVGEYTRRISIFGPAERDGTFDAWCYVYDALRTYSCRKVVRGRELASGLEFTGDQLRAALGWPPLTSDS
jgi:hypothetical protein